MKQVCNAASELEEYSLIKTSLGGQEVLQNLIGNICRTGEMPFRVSAAIETMLLLVKLSVKDAKCLRFIWSENQSEYLLTLKIHPLFFGCNRFPHLC